MSAFGYLSHGEARPLPKAGLAQHFGKVLRYRMASLGECCGGEKTAAIEVRQASIS
jgi:hypothetical protein